MISKHPLEAESQQQRKSRKGLAKQFDCDEPNCGKSFTRYEHLCRHQLNHKPKEIYYCEWPQCRKTFVREDLKIRHMDRHKRREMNEASKKGRDLTVPYEEDSRRRSSFKNQLNEFQGSHQIQISHPSSDLRHDAQRGWGLQSQSASQIRHDIAPAYDYAGPAQYGSAASPPPYLHTKAHIASLLDVDAAGHPQEQPQPPLDAQIEPQLFDTQLRYEGYSNYYAPAHTPAGAASASAPAQNGIADQRRLSELSNHTAAGSGPARNGHPVKSEPVAENPRYTYDTANQPAAQAAIAPESELTGEAEPSPTELISWLFSDAMMSNARDPLISPPFYQQLESPSAFNSLLSPPAFADDSLLSEAKRQELLEIFPALRATEFSELPYMQRHISRYWTFFHPQFPILHHPSFCANETPNGLLWAMIMIGSDFESSASVGSAAATVAPSNANDQPNYSAIICEDLRWFLLGNKEFEPPAKLWVLQSLVLLEIFEKQRSSRRHHERAHIHHATTLQLLRRGPALTGTDSPSDETDPWKRWINAECTKRIGLVAFMLDSFDSIMFGHSMVMSIHEIRLSLPCPESAWEAYPSNKTLPRFNNVGFLTALKLNLNRKHVETGSFGRKVLLAGLLAIANQMKDRDMQVSTVGFGEHLKDTWREVLSLAYDFWKKDFDDTLRLEDERKLEEKERQKAVKEETRNPGSPASSVTTAYALEVHGCPTPYYHLAHITLRVGITYLQVYCGSPSLLNYQNRQSDFDLAAKKVSDWVNSDYGREAYWHALQFLIEMYFENNDVLPDRDHDLDYSLACTTCPCPYGRGGLTSTAPTRRNSVTSSPKADSAATATAAAPGISDLGLMEKRTKVNYQAASDPFGKRPNVLYQCGLIIWAYGYHKNGPESDFLEGVEAPKRPAHGNADDYANLVLAQTSGYKVVEKGHDYLQRMAVYKANKIDTAEGLNQTAGFLRMLIDSLEGHRWELVHEDRRLLIHCLEKTLGRQVNSCQYLFEKKR